MEIDILIEEFAWFTDDIEGLAEVACPATLAELGLNPAHFEISILACDDDKMATLNEAFLGKPNPTNVLSWPARNHPELADGAMPEMPAAEDGLIELGDIALGHAICRREADAAGKTLADHATHLLIHGTLHLLGFDHVRDGDAALMQRIETDILAKLGIADPY